jgi:phosphatidylserine decarboxylase
MDMGRYLIGILTGLFILLPLGIKWEIEKKIVIPAAIMIGLVGWYIIENFNNLIPIPFYFTIALQIMLILIISGGCILFRFYRDPDRIPEKKENVILSPADGKIIYIKNIDEREIPFSEKNGKTFSLTELVQSERLSGKGFLVGIAMNFLDVHVNRAPIKGEILLIKHIKGLFISLKNKAAVIQNERVFTIIENSSIQIGMVQIASRLVRNIVPYVKEGTQVDIGQRIGMIRFGSQVDLVIPDNGKIKFMVKNGEKIKAGLTIVASFK